MITSTLTTKGQATIPAEIRNVLKLKPGDKVAFEMHGNEVVIYKPKPFDQLYHAAISNLVAEEWDSSEDDEAYRDL